MNRQKIEVTGNLLDNMMDGKDVTGTRLCMLTAINYTKGIKLIKRLVGFGAIDEMFNSGGLITYKITESGKVLLKEITIMSELLGY